MLNWYYYCFALVPHYVGSVQVTSQSDTSSIVQWTPPLHPNGVIIKYRLTFTNSNSTIPSDITVDGNVMSYTITNLGVLAYGLFVVAGIILYFPCSFL